MLKCQKKKKIKFLIDLEPWNKLLHFSKINKSIWIVKTNSNNEKYQKFDFKLIIFM